MVARISGSSPDRHLMRLKRIYNDDVKYLATKANDYFIQKCNRVVQDIEKEARILDQLCHRCYYNVSVVGMAFTDSECGNCGVHLQYSNTDIDLLCKQCAKELGVCVHCGSKLW